jgi:OHCU decarboxylase
MTGGSGLDRLNALPAPAAEAALLQCCGSTAWAREMIRRRPFATTEELLDTADAVWRGLSPDDWLEAFRSHPRIGERPPPPQPDGDAARAGHARWSAEEQAGVDPRDADLAAALAEGNRRYEAKFGHIFLICASGLSGSEMRAALERRLDHEPAAELAVAAEEQRRITRIRLRKLVHE